MTTPGTLYGIGVGPGDPELLTLKAARLIGSAPVVAYLTNLQGRSRAREIASGCLRPSQQEVAIPMPFSTERGPANRAYDKAAATLAEALEAGRDVAALCEGDPLFFGSFSYLYERLAARYPCIVVPGITAVSGATAATALVFASANERVAIVPATAGDEPIRDALQSYESVAIIKPGRHRPRILALLRETGRMDDTIYVEQASSQGQRIIRRLADLDASPGPYFALFLVSSGGRPWTR
jgi:precorrin-2/cobalt-factor-2 C20-methyltransferase